MTDEVVTLGARLDALGRRLAARHVLVPPVALAAHAALERAQARSQPYDGRFDRHESTVNPHPLPVRRRPGAARAADGGAARPGVSRTDPAEVVARVAAVPAPAAPGDRPDAEPVQAQPSSGRPLPFDVRAGLREVVGPAADAMRVHDGPAADALARRHRADAVTVGTDVHLRAGRWRPAEPDGFALLAHEATHVAATLGGQAWRRDAPAGVAGEEAAALATEAAARAMALTWTGGGPAAAAATGERSVTPAPGAGSAARRPAAPAAPAPDAVAARPMTAATDRSVAVPAGLDVEALRRELVGDLMRQLRSEFERGA